MAGEVEISGDDSPYPLEIDYEDRVWQLQFYRKLLVRTRRSEILSMLETRQHNKATGDLRPQNLKSIQDEIEAVDRAIEDETRLKAATYK
jgi:hypothetical protein